MEERFIVKPVGVKYICDYCKAGEMQATGEIKMYEKYANFIHKCKKCFKKKELKEKYPLIRYE
ncbi:hypothetical protein MKY20_20005 [Cytobacillus sp. FSL W8-0315]|uniref:hypothetical protein n=1 Tax=Cytobacillus sp. FSL W8-0315 TaxID=2921600 RepID=UPI0030FC3482